MGSQFWKTPCISLLILLVNISPTSQNSREKRDISADQPRIITQNGHLVFQTGTNYDITFKAINGGKIKFGESDVTGIATLVQKNKDDIDTLKNSPTAIPNNIEARLTTLKGRLDNLVPTGTVKTNLDSLRADLTTFQTAVPNTVNTRLTAVENSINQPGGAIRSQITSFTTSITALQTKAQQNKVEIDRLKNSPTSMPSNVESRLNTLQNRLDNLQPTGAVNTQLTSLRRDLTRIQGTIPNAVSYRLTALENSINQPTGTVKSQLTSLDTRLTSLQQRVTTIESLGQTALQTRIQTLERTVQNLQTLLITNECTSNPCRNGGTCMDVFNGYICKCPSNWQGLTCEMDVNECAIYAGTDMGCQNGATCTNSPGSFTCHCTHDWHGIRCTSRHEDCTGASQTELCGHGTCVNVARTTPNQPKYNCICDDGWTSGSDSPACTVDVDECSTESPSCSSDPPVQCINIPGSFRCGNCPTGFTGNGFTCMDINECETNNGGCSQSPRVECINTRGSRRCAACPSGYQGDGVTCMWVGVCNVNNGGCNSLATCTETSGVGGRTCVCPSGYAGNGVGNTGCIRQSPAQGACLNNPCQNGGICQNVGSGYQCVCNGGYTGRNCDTVIDMCASNPCLNGGTCVGSVGSYVCQCTGDATGPNCEQAQQSCGGALRSESGSFRYPRTQGTEYDHAVSCAWVIETTAGKVLTITFSSFDLEAHQSCSYDYLQIHDGGSASSHMIGKYCGTVLPNGGSINSTTNKLYLWFYSDASVAGNGFSVSWTSSDPVCGGRLSGSDHGSINSPGYPGNYPHNRDCVWVVSVSPGKKIIFTFATLALEHHDNCTYDYLQIRDGQLDTSDVLNTYCSTSSPSPITTTGPYAWVMFHSDRSLNDRGFHITYAAISAGPQCGGELTEDEGIVISPNYPSPYNHNAQCVWTITVTPGDKVQLTFTNMDLESHSSCRYDYIEVRDGRDQTSSLIGKFCGGTIPAVLTSTNNTMWIMFRSDQSQRGTGFRATWTAACGGTFTSTSGTIQSPAYPGSYPHNKECVYLINQPSGYRVSLSFNAFDIERANSAGECRYDFLEVRDGGADSSPSLGKFCGATMPTDLTTTQNVMRIKFKTDGSVANNGFQATYTREVDVCGSSFTENTGTISSPGHPTPYPHGANCTWHITVTPGFIIRITFHSFSTEGNADNCRFDYLEVFDDFSGNANNSLGKYCGSSRPPVLTSSSNVMTLKFKSDSSLAYEGFSATYVALNVSTLCGSTLTDTSGVITSPNYPGNYPHQRECIWTIIVPNRNQIQLNVSDFELERHSNCNYDYLEIRNGGYATSPLIGKFCGTTIDRNIVSHSNRLWIKLKTDASSAHRGFSISYDGASQGCGGDLTSPSGSLISPNYPGAYAHNAECFWTITVAQGNRIMLTFIDLDVESHYRCNYDYIQIREGSELGEDRGKFCGTTSPSPIVSHTNKIYIKYRTDPSVGGRGFQIYYSTTCNTRLTSHSGVLESPNFPQPYPHFRNCTWTIQTTMGNKLNVTFTNFDVESHTNCSFDYLKIFDVTTPTPNAIGTYCGNTLPAPFSSTSNTLRLNFVTDTSVSGSGFRMQWVTDGCGGEFFKDTGGFTSPNYPNTYASNRECIWKITVGTGKSVELTIHTFDLESHATCRYDYLNIYGGPDSSAPRLAQLCHTQTTAQVLQTTGNTMYVQFKTDRSVTGTGFNTTFKAIAGGCGGNFSTPTGTIVSKDYPSNYPHNTNCQWLITVAEGRPIEITFEDFQVENSENCTYDYVAIYDGASSTAPELMKHCGTSLPTPSVYLSSSNQVYIIMNSDPSVTSRGFKASYVTGCGGRKNAETDGVITSSNYPAAYDRNSNCTWLIESDHNTDRITLTFTHMDIEKRGSTCNHDYVKVLDGNNANSPEIGTYCGNSIPVPITSQGSALFLVFISDSSVQQTGFRVTYTKSASSCGGDFTSESGSFTSPSYPNSYPLNTECVWTMRSSAGNQVALSFSVFSIESSSNCESDYVEVRQGSATGSLMGKYCGSTIPSNLTSANSIWMKFRSDDVGTGTGFIGTFSSVYGGEISGRSGQIASPQYPGVYPHNVDYTWRVTAPVGMRIRLTFTAFDVEGPSGSTCVWDYLKILDGGSTDSTELTRLCGRSIPTPIITTSNQIQLMFHTDSSSNGNGFLLNWEATTDMPQFSTTPSPSGSTQAPGCGGTLFSTYNSQTLQSPGYPNGYADNLDCIWIIQAPVGHRVAANITYMDIESHGSCNFDRVVFYNGRGVSRTDIGSYCGRRTNTNLIMSRSNILTVRFKTDRSFNNTGFAMNFMTGCGGEIQDQTSGIITSPSYPGNYPANQNCTWSVKMVNGRTVSVTFNGTFNLPGSDYVQLLNGDDLNSPALGNGTDRSGNGRYYGNQSPQPLETSSNWLVVNFISDASTSGSGFSLIYREVRVTCGGRISLVNGVTTGYITSPNYPQFYPHNVDCEWVILAPGTEKVQVDFEDAFNIESHSSCNYDYVEFRDGGTENSNLINNVRYCGDTAPGTIRSTGNVMYIRFRTDSSARRVGFKLKYKTATCGGTIKGYNGTITSPSYPSNYPANSDCEWYIQAPTGHYITFTFNAFNLENSGNCVNDYLQIREFNSTGTSLMKRCGSRLPDSFDTSDSYAYMRFRSNSAIASTGFSLLFQSSVEVCGGDLRTPSGTFTSPNYPGLYAHNRVCTWRIYAQPGRRITLTFNDLRLEDSRSCTYDYVKIVNGVLRTSPELKRFCGDQQAQVVESSGNTMTVIFKSDGSRSNGGFSASYTSQNEALCGGIITTPGNITSPGYLENGNYSNGQECIWQLRNPSITNSSIKITVNDLALEPTTGSQCTFDYLRIREGTDETGRILESFCGNNTIPLPVVSPYSSLWIRFKSDRSVVDRGFNIDFNFTSCGGILTQSSGVITSPNYPANYDHNDACGWKILAPEGTRIRVKFTNFTLERHLNCVYDYLEIFNGGNPDSPSIGKFCGNDPPAEFVSQSNSIRLVFRSDVSMSEAGFQLEYSFETGGCGGLFHGNNGTFTSPNYPSNYPHSTECMWDINVENGYTIELAFNSPFAMESHSSCRYDYVEIFDSSSNGTLISQGRYCDNTVPPVLKSSGNRIVVKFRSDTSVNGQGFSANWTVGCGGIFTTDTGTFISPGYPNLYPNNLNCSYGISVDPQKFILLNFNSRAFDIEAGSTCQYDALSIYAGNDTSGDLKGKFCGKTPPQPISGQGNLFMTFKTDGSIQGKGFVAHYIAQECGGVFTEPRGILRTPTHPTPYHNNANCTWTITVEPNRVVYLKFLSFDVEYHRNCYYDYVDVRDGGDLNAPLLGRFCGNQIPNFLRTTGNQMHINFITDSSLSRGGFSAAYMTTYGVLQGCGGVLNNTLTLPGALSSLDGDGDGQYENNLDCAWTIIVGRNKLATFNITGMDMEPNTACRYDSLKIYDGMSDLDPLIGSYCGSTVPPSIVASSNFLYVVLHTDSSVVATGFNATYGQKDALCGGSFTATNTAQTISSPNYPSPAGQAVKCRWVIDSGSASNKVRIQITDIRLASTANCPQEYVQIRDSPLGEFGQAIHFCGSTVPASYDSVGQVIVVDYNIPAGSRSSGFQLQFMIADCNRNITASNGKLMSPGFPGNYDRNLDCDIRIMAPAGTSLSLYFNKFNIEAHTRCNYDYLEIHNGSSPSDGIVSKLCGPTIPDPVFVSSNEIYMNFKTDSSVTRLGYDISFTSTTAGLGCGGTLSGINGSLTSPGYPGNFTDVQTCRWLIKVPARRTIKLTFTTLEVIGVSDCSNNYVTVYDGSTEVAPFGQYCGDVDVAMLTTSSNRAYVKFVSTGTSNAPTFRLTYYS